MTHRILIVDDEKDIRGLIALILQNAGYDVLEAGSGEEGLDLLTSERVDLVTLDVMMPGMTGWEVCAHIKANPALRHIPVIILTARSLLRDEEELTAVAPDAFLNKPFNVDNLLARVSSLLAATPA